jgi:hypothetical protein
MSRTSRIKTICRLAAAVGIVIGVLLFAGAAAADGEDLEKPVAFAFGVAPGSVSVNWEHSGSGVAYYTVTRESPYQVWGNVSAEQRNLFDSNLQPNTEYRYFVCAYFADLIGSYSCSEWSEPARTHAPAPPAGGSPGGTPPPASQPPAPAFTPVLTAKPHGGAQVYLTWNTPPAGSIALTRVPLYRDGEEIYQALEPGNLDGDHVDTVRPNSTHRYMLCYEGPAIGERCSAEVVAGPQPVTPTAPAGLRAAEVLISGGRTPDGSIILRPQHRVSFDWRNTDIPGVFITVERQDVKIARNPDPNSPVGHIRQSIWSELARLNAKENPTSATVDAPDTSNPALEPGESYRVCALVPVLGDTGKVCTQPITPDPPAHVQPSSPPVVSKPTVPPCLLRAGGC